MEIMPDNEHGYVMVVALMVVALLTVICVSASQMSTTEVQITRNELLYERAFYTAEAGLSRLRPMLKASYPLPDGCGALTSNPDWNFALTTAADTNEDGLGDPEGGVVSVSGELNGISYRVVIWNNDDGGGAETDLDALIYARSDAWGPRDARCRIETILRINPGRESIAEYAQEGAGPKNCHVGNDVNLIRTFNAQVTGLH